MSEREASRTASVPPVAHEAAVVPAGRDGSATVAPPPALHGGQRLDASALGVLAAPEPLLTSVLHGAKAGGFFALFMWAFDSTGGIGRFAFHAAWMGGLEVLRRRTGDQFSPAAFRVMGVAVAATGAGIAALSVQRDTAEVLPVGVVAVVAGTALLIAGIRKQRREDALRAAPTPVLAPDRRIPRRELDARLERQAEALAPRNRRLIWGFGAALGTLLLATTLPDLLGVGEMIPDAVYGAGIVAFFGGLIGTLWHLRRTARADAAVFKTQCPQCSRPLQDGFVGARKLKLLELAGLCPHCGTQIIEESA